MKEPLWLSKAFIFAVHEQLLAEHGGSAGLRDGGLLESALNRPIHFFAYGKPNLFDLAAAYAFGLCKNHPFIDGNKRVAFVAAVSFLDANRIELTAGEMEAKVMMEGLASGDRTETEFSQWLEENSVSGKRSQRRK